MIQFYVLLTNFNTKYAFNNSFDKSVFIIDKGAFLNQIIFMQNVIHSNETQAPLTTRSDRSA